MQGEDIWAETGKDVCLGVMFERKSKKNLKEAGMTGGKQEGVQRRGWYRASPAGTWDGVPSALGGCQGLL